MSDAQLVVFNTARCGSQPRLWCTAGSSAGHKCVLEESEVERSGAAAGGASPLMA